MPNVRASILLCFLMTPLFANSLPVNDYRSTQGEEWYPVTSGYGDGYEYTYREILTDKATPATGLRPKSSSCPNDDEDISNFSRLHPLTFYISPNQTGVNYYNQSGHQQSAYINLLSLKLSQPFMNSRNSSFFAQAAVNNSIYGCETWEESTESEIGCRFKPARIDLEGDHYHVTQYDFESNKNACQISTGNRLSIYEVKETIPTSALSAELTATSNPNTLLNFERRAKRDLEATYAIRSTEDIVNFPMAMARRSSDGDSELFRCNIDLNLGYQRFQNRILLNCFNLKAKDSSIIHHAKDTYQGICDLDKGTCIDAPLTHHDERIAGINWAKETFIFAYQIEDDSGNCKSYSECFYEAKIGSTEAVPPPPDQCQRKSFEPEEYAPVLYITDDQQIAFSKLMDESLMYKLHIYFDYGNNSKPVRVLDASPKFQHLYDNEEIYLEQVLHVGNEYRLYGYVADHEGQKSFELKYRKTREAR
ncbi:hypothetical protein EOPP23_00560 [Endozoicomonas sp. OPT23]|uniref:hypothetical protein n=1 Tax=Endozoicomonas sp. OPT23 TaxID=2072845 RepID=UPI00129B5031|nr:hypothetical protein [Endozoicomonas sp. OPT23]MRI31481.1 hypothetical protein [Endozoicomonas sp. OPT23]